MELKDSVQRDDSSQIRLIWLVIIKERGTEGFRKIHPSPTLWEPFKVLERLLVLELTNRQPI